MFVIVEAAIYRHRVMGIADDLDAAIDLAGRAAHTERSPHGDQAPDGHHRYQILEVPVGELVDDGVDRGFVAYVVDFGSGDGSWTSTVRDLCYWSSSSKTTRHRPDRILEPAPTR